MTNSEQIGYIMSLMHTIDDEKVLREITAFIEKKIVENPPAPISEEAYA
jgi:hypothetical protein